MSHEPMHVEYRRFQRVSVPQASSAVSLLDIFLADIEGDPTAVRYHDLRLIESAKRLVAEVKERNV